MNWQHKSSENGNNVIRKGGSMKENVANNEKLLTLLEDHAADYKDDADTLRTNIQAYFSISRHSLRAWFSRLANPKKYDGKYAERMKPFIRAVKTKPVAVDQNVADICFQIGSKKADENANIVTPVHHPVMTEHGVVAIPSKEYLANMTAKPKIMYIDAAELESLEEMLELDTQV